MNKRAYDKGYFDGIKAAEERAERQITLTIAAILKQFPDHKVSIPFKDLISIDGMISTWETPDNHKVYQWSPKTWGTHS